MDRNEMLNWLVENVKQWPGSLFAQLPALPGAWGWYGDGTYALVSNRKGAHPWHNIAFDDWEAARDTKCKTYTRDEVLAHCRKYFEPWPTCLEDTCGHLGYLPGWSWSVDEHGFMKLGDITYLDFYDVLPREWMIKHLEAHLDEWPRVCDQKACDLLKGTRTWFWRGREGHLYVDSETAGQVAAADTRIPISPAEPRKTSYFATRSLADELAELLQCKPDQVLDTVRNLVPDWHTVPAPVDVLQPVWSHAQGHKQPKRVFLHRPKAPVDQETVGGLLARFDKDSLQEAFK